MSKYVTGTTSQTPITNISYVSLEEFEKQVEHLKSEFDVSVCYIFHYGENGKKDHIHYIVKSNGNKLSNVPKIMKIMYNYDVDGQRIDSLYFHQCKSIGDYHEYILHNPVYLASKGETRQFSYKESDILGDKSFKSNMQVLGDELDITDKTTLGVVLDKMSRGFNDIEILNEFKDNMKLTEIGLALNSINKLRKCSNIDYDTELFYTKLGQTVYDVADMTPDTYNNNIRGVGYTKGHVCTTAEIGEMWFTAFVQFVQRYNGDVTSLLLNE